jgi:hypothetical protein
MAEEERIDHGERAVHAHDEDDGKRGARVDRAERPGQK